MITLLLLVTSIFFEQRTFGFITPTAYKTQVTKLKGDFFDDISKPEPNVDGENEDAGGNKAEEEFKEMPLEELEAMAPEWDEHVPKFCSVSMVGRVGNDPEPRYFDSGKVVLNLSLACKRKYHPLERQALNIKEDATDWFNLEIWGKTAEYAASYVTKGARIGVIGSLTVDFWDDKQTGDLRRKPVIIVRELEILESKAEAELRRQNKEDAPRKSFYTDDDDEDDGYSAGSAGTGGFF